MTIQARQANQSTALTLRALILSAISVVVFTVAGNVSVLKRYEILGTGYLPRGVVFFLLVLSLYNVVVKRWLPRARLRREELMVVFCALLAMDGIPAQDFAQHFYLNLTAMVQHTTSDPLLQDLKIPDHFRPGMLPSTDPQSPVIKWIYTGLPDGASVPYRAWLLTYVIWTPYIFLLYWLLLWSAALISFHWEEHERLLFPLIQIPLETVETPAGQLSEILKSKLMWTTFALITLMYTLIFLRAYYPFLPEIKVSKTTEQLFKEGPLTTFNYMLLEFRPEMIGIAYLLTTEMAFSLWFFYFFRHFEIILRTMHGLTTPHNIFLQYQAGGGYLVLGIALLWKARGYLRDCWKTAWSEEEESSFYRMCFLGIATGYAGIVSWCWFVGISLHWAIIQFTLFVLVSLVASRVICEGGMFLYSSPLFGLGTFLFSGWGRSISPKDMTLITSSTWVDIRNSSSMAMPFMMQTFKMGSTIGLKRLQTAWLMFGAIVLAVLTCHISVPYILYHNGIGKLADWPQGSGMGTVTSLTGFINNPTGMDQEKWTGVLTGGALVWFLVEMRQQFLWWPFHPLGFVASLWGWPIDRYWFCIFLGWLAKVTVLRLGGYRAYRALRPVAFGLILGLSFVMTAWMILHYKWPGPAAIFD